MWIKTDHWNPDIYKTIIQNTLAVLNKNTMNTTEISTKEAVLSYFCLFLCPFCLCTGFSSINTVLCHDNKSSWKQKNTQHLYNFVFCREQNTTSVQHCTHIMIIWYLPSEKAVQTHHTETVVIGCRLNVVLYNDPVTTALWSFSGCSLFCCWTA